MKIDSANSTMKIQYDNSRSVARTFVPVLLVSVCVLTGCLSRPYLKKETFSFDTPVAATTNVIKDSHVLGIRSLKIAAPFEGRSFVYRTGEFSFERDPYAEFLVPPAEALMSPVCEWLRRNGNFSAVVEAGSALKPDTLVEIGVSQLFGDFRQPEHPAAILTMRFVFFDATNGVPGKAIFQQGYSRSIPLGTPATAELMKGWNQALDEILVQMSSDFRQWENSAPAGGAN
jgi:cholesterol transport system auxiliary component